MNLPGANTVRFSMLLTMLFPIRRTGRYNLRGLLVAGTLAVVCSTLAMPSHVSAEYGAGATASGNGCLSRQNPEGIRLWIHVTHWCIVPGVRGQAQFKVQMRIHNQSRHRLDIGQDRVRVIVRRFDPDHWSPARIGQPTLDRPVQTTFHGETVWAVPANADRAYDVFPNKPEPTHATHWPISQLGPKQTLNPHYHYGDLVYDLPMPRRKPPRWSMIHNIVGVAYIKGRSIIALCRPASWGSHRPAGTF
jgi:hypothetical protein